MDKTPLVDGIFLQREWRSLVTQERWQDALDFLDVKLSVLAEGEAGEYPNIKATVLWMKGDTYIGMGLYQEAVTQYQQAYELFRNDVFLLAMGKAYHRMGNVQLSEETFAKIRDKVVLTVLSDWRQMPEDIRDS